MLSSTSATTTDAATIPVTATFSEEVTGFAAGDIEATGGSISGFSSGTTTYTFNVVPSGPGTVTVMVPADVASSTASTTPGNQASNTLTFTSTLNETPTISNVAAGDITSTGATITWNTNIPATSQVFYGTTTNYGLSSALSTTTTTSHSVALSGLTPATTYNFQVASGNGEGTATSSNRTFTSLSTATTSLAIVSVTAVSTTAVADNSFENGWKWVVRFTVPTDESNFALRFNDFTESSNASTTIPVANNLRYYTEQSSNAGGVGDAITAANNSYGTTMNLTGDADTGVAGRQIDVAIEMKIPTGTQTGSYSTLFGARSSATTTTP